MVEKALGYKDIGLISRHVSEIKSRSQCDTSVDFCGIKLDIPLIVSPMLDTGGSRLLTKVRELGGYGYVHRFQSIEQRIEEYKRCPSEIGCAIGLNDSVGEIYQMIQTGCKHFCIDTANGANFKVKSMIKYLRETYKYDISIITGNVASAECFDWLDKQGVDGIRVGIAGGKACTTKTATGLFYPMVSTILEIKENNLSQTSVIADGGIEESRDMCKALAVGADVVMAGGIFAGTEESPSKPIKLNGELFKLFRGSASFSTQEEFTGKKPKYVEGMEYLVPFTGSVEKLITSFKNGLQSSMSYMNAKNLTEYRQNVDWCEL